jgi:hypothetical protein
MFRYPIFALLGAALGIVMIAGGNRQQGIPVAALGAFLGTLLATKGASLARTLRLFAATMFTYNIPIGRDKAYEWVDQDSKPIDPETNFGERLLCWAMAPDVVNCRRWLVCAGLALGAITGVIVAAHDLAAVNAGRQGWMLPMRGARDPLLTQAGLIALGWIIWGGVAGGFFASAVFRRPLILAIAVAAFISTCIGYAASEHSRVSTFAITVFVSTGAAVVALIWGFCVSDRSAAEESPSDRFESPGS